MMAKATGKRPDIEHELAEKYHVDFAFHTAVPTSEFDIDRSLANQARFEAVKDETVQRYAEAIERGDTFPAVVAYRPGRSARSKLVMIDGNHRLVAHDRVGKPLDVYEIDRGTRPQHIALLTFALNGTHGEPTSEEERVAHALYLIDNGAAQEDAAAAVNAPIRLVKRALAQQNADRRADEVGIDRREWDSLAKAARQRLLNISTDEGFKDAVHLAYVGRLGAEEVFELVTLLNSSRSATRQRALIKNETERYQDQIQANAAGVIGTNKARLPMTAKQRVGIVLGQVLALPDDVGALSRAWAEAERRDAATRVIDASNRLRKLASAIDPSVK